ERARWARSDRLVAEQPAEVRGELPGVRVAARRVLLEALLDDRRQVAAQRRVDVAERLRLHLRDAPRRIRETPAVNVDREAPGQQLEQRRAEAVDVAARVDRTARHLFRAHVAERPDDLV